MATKKELIEDLVEMGHSEEELEGKTNKQLEKMIADSESTSAPSQAELMMAQMQEQMALMMKQMESLKAENQNLKVEKVEAETKLAEAPKKVTNIDKDRLIPVMNITPHGLVYISKRTGAEWNWTHYGDIEHMELAELLTMRNAHRKFLDDPFILIMDDDAVSYLGLEKMYATMIEPDNIDKVFKMKVSEFKDVVNSSPKGIQILIAQRAKELVEKGELDSMSKINFINEKFGTDLGL
jgi:hypothetical protein